MQLYETIEYPQPSNTVICRGKHPSASLKLVFSPKIRTFSVEHIWHEGLIVVQNEDEILDVSFGTTQSPNVKTLALGLDRTVKLLELVEEIREEIQYMKNLWKVKMSA